ncbi:MAG TPA: bile acid:sodium symporter family protein [Spirochaetota bacterium]|nr:bile acid:sodium symporter family protein [Spirochaetota bacterium]
MKILNILNRLFLLWIVLFSLAAWVFPSVFSGSAFLINPGLGVIMFGMGITLKPEDFTRIVKNPSPVLIGLMLQFLLMPALARGIATAFGFGPETSTGFILLGSCPGGTASNVITFLAGGNVALSVTMTTFSTVLSPVVTPALTGLLASKWVTVPFLKMFLSILYVIILPVVLGLGARSLFESRIETIKPVFQFLSVLAIAFIIAVIVALNRSTMGSGIAVTAVATVLHNTLGLLSGYWFSRALRVSKRNALTIAIEVGMQNSGLAVKLALDFFSAAAAVPGALFSIWHNVSGAVLSFVCQARVASGELYGEEGGPEK